MTGEIDLWLMAAVWVGFLLTVVALVAFQGPSDDC